MGTKNVPTRVLDIAIFVDIVIFANLCTEKHKYRAM